MVGGMALNPATCCPSVSFFLRHPFLTYTYLLAFAHFNHMAHYQSSTRVSLIGYACICMYDGGHSNKATCLWSIYEEMVNPFLYLSSKRVIRV